MAHCPANSSRRGPHTALIGLIRDAGVNIAIGTDNMTEDMFQAMKIGMIVHRGGRGREKEGGVDPQPQAMLDAITRSAARSVGAQAEIGSIELGKKADLTLLDLNMPSMRPIIRLVANVVHYGHPGIVHSVMADGVFLMRDRKVLTLDEPALLQEAQLATGGCGSGCSHTIRTLHRRLAALRDAPFQEMDKRIHLARPDIGVAPKVEDAIKYQERSGWARIGHSGAFPCAVRLFHLRRGRLHRPVRGSAED